MQVCAASGVASCADLTGRRWLLLTTSSHFSLGRQSGRHDSESRSFPTGSSSTCLVAPSRTGKACAHSIGSFALPPSLSRVAHPLAIVRRALDRDVPANRRRSLDLGARVQSAPTHVHDSLQCAAFDYNGHI